MIEFKNNYYSLSDKFYRSAIPEKIENPKLIYFNDELAKDLKIDLHKTDQNKLTKIFSGNLVDENCPPISLAYAGHQFGHFVPQLGDGRAHLLGQLNGYDVQLKGSGKTFFSRRGDGKSALGPVLRETVLSEAMHTLGIPTTRALCAIETNENIYRQFGMEPGGIFTRVSRSHLRVGTFQYFAARKDKESLSELLKFSCQIHYPKLLDIDDESTRSLEFLKEVARKQASLIANWSRVGFIHGVMNTDNYSIGGHTIDYGPCAFIDNFEFEKTFSSIDANGRYSYFNQVPIGQWNLLRLADTLIPLIDKNDQTAIKKVETILPEIMSLFPKLRFIELSKKIGINDYNDKDEPIILEFLKILEEFKLDFTNSFINIDELYNEEFHFFPNNQKVQDFIIIWKNRIPQLKIESNVNPILIPRNHLIEKMIDMAYGSDYSMFNKMMEAYKTPYEDDKRYQELQLAPKANEVIKETFCGT